MKMTVFLPLNSLGAPNYLAPLFSSSQYTAPSLGAAVPTSSERQTGAVQHCGPQHCRIQNIKQMRSSERSSSTRYSLFHGEASRVGIVTSLQTERPRNRSSHRSILGYSLKYKFHMEVPEKRPIDTNGASYNINREILFVIG
jgi:hypothetical protein